MPSEYTVRWAGGRIGLGATVFHFQSTASPTVAQGAATAIRAFFSSLGALLPNGINLAFDNEVRVLEADGTLTAVLPVVAPAVVNGSGGTDYINGAGGLIRWTTGAVVGGRRLLGRTFLVPMESGSFVSGNLSPTATSIINGAAEDLIADMAAASATLQVWSRVNAAVADVIVGAAVSRPSSLRTRNDRD